MDRYAILVDAGYFFAGGAQAAFGASTPRKQLSLKSPDDLVKALDAEAGHACGQLALLRVYWYDALPGNRLSLEQNNIAMLAGVKLRLGALNSAGEQKGVDSLIVTDLIDLARNKAITDAVLVSGDEDLRIGVQVAQSFGVRIHILAAGDPKKNVSPALQMEADSVRQIPDVWFSQHFLRSAPAVALPLPQGPMVPAPPAATGPSGTPPNTVEEAAAAEIKLTLASLQPEQLANLKSHFATNTTVPPEFDRKLIARISKALGGQQLTGNEMRSIRGLFVRAIRGA